MYGQGNYPSQYRPQFQQSQTIPPPPPPFQQAPSAPPPPPIPLNQPHSVVHQGPTGPQPPLHYQHNVPPPQQPGPSYLHSSSQPYLPPPPPIQGNLPPPYPQPNTPYPTNHLSQSVPVPPRMFPPPPPPLHSQGQVMYRIPPPPPPGIQHVPAPPPPPPSGFASVTPAPFAPYTHSTGNAYPPSLPPPPPPPPPSSPPPLPPSPPPPSSPPPSSPTTEFPSIPKELSPDPLAYGVTNASVAPNVDEVGKSENKDPAPKADALEDHLQPPPKPADEEVFRNIEVLCRFMANVGPDFENLARTKEAKNPKFAFLFGGEPGSVAATEHQYFQWMKRKHLSVEYSAKEHEQNIPSPKTLKMAVSSPSGNYDEGAAVSPAASDMDMEDDACQPDAQKVADELSKEPASEAVCLDSGNHAVIGTFSTLVNTTDQLAPEVAASGIVSETDDGEDGKVSSFLEDVSPVRHTPDAAEETSKNSVQGSTRVPIVDSSQVNVPSISARSGTMETTRVYVKDGSPFRLIQDYASDDSEEEDNRENDDEPEAAVGAGIHENERSKLPSSLTSDNISALEVGSSPRSDSSQLSHPTMSKEGEPLGGLPDKATSPSAICPPVDLSNEIIDLQDNKQNDKVVKCEPCQNNDLLGGGNIDADDLIGKHPKEHDANQVSAKLDVDEFGRLVRKGASDSDSDDGHFSGSRVKRGRNRSRSRSPQESRWRRRSRSPRRREKRSRSRSWSPRRMRSKSPQTSRRMAVSSRRDQDQPPECLNFNRGRCFRGASCRFLHRDSARHMSRQYDISRDSGNEGRHDPATSFGLNKTIVTEMDIEEHGDAPQEDTKSIDMQSNREQSGSENRSTDAEDVGERDVSNSDIREVEVVHQISQEAVNHVETLQVGEAVESSKSNLIEEPHLKSSHFLQDDSTRIQSASPGSHQPPQITNSHNDSEPQGVAQSSQEGSPSHQLPHLHTGQSPVNEFMPTKDFLPLGSPGSDVNFQRSQQVPPGPPGPPPFPHFPLDTLNAPLPSQHPSGILHPPATGYQSQPPLNRFPSHRPPMASDYHPHSMPRTNPGWYNVPPLPPTLHAMPPRHDFHPMMRPHPPGEMIHPTGGDLHPRPFHSIESSHQPPFHMDEHRRPIPMETYNDHLFVRDQFPGPPMADRLQIMSDSQRDHHLRNQSSREEARIPLPDQGFASSSLFGPASTTHLQSVANRMHHLSEEHVDGRPFSREEFSSSTIKHLPYSLHPPLYSQQRAGSSNYPPNMNTTGLVDSSFQRYPSRFLDNRPPPHYNPFASTFEQVPTAVKYVSNASGREHDMIYNIKYGSQFSSEHASVSRPESRLTSSPPDSKRSSEQILPRVGLNSEGGALSDTQKLARNPVAGDAYDPLFDSIEPSSNAPKNHDHVGESNSAVRDGGIVSKPNSLHKSADVEEDNKQKEIAVAEYKSEVDEFGEMATDAEVGVVENASPQPEKEWSPDLPVDMENPAAGEIEIDQVRSPGKSKKSKDSRSMKLFKVALADFVKEVLKPSWRQGNMSKEAFKTIVKKTVDKVSGAMPNNQIPKSQAKINQYVESSQRKLTKLVMGYVDKYVKM